MPTDWATFGRAQDASSAQDSPQRRGATTKISRPNTRNRPGIRARRRNVPRTIIVGSSKAAATVPNRLRTSRREEKPDAPRMSNGWPAIELISMIAPGVTSNSPVTSPAAPTPETSGPIRREGPRTTVDILARALAAFSVSPSGRDAGGLRVGPEGPATSRPTPPSRCARPRPGPPRSRSWGRKRRRRLPTSRSRCNRR